GSEHHMAHELAGAHQQPARNGQLDAEKESHVDVSSESIDVTERRILHARGRMTVMQQLPNILSARAHDLEPTLRDISQRAGMLLHPALDCWIPPDCTRKQHESTHGIDFLVARAAPAKKILFKSELERSLPQRPRYPHCTRRGKE